MDMMQLNQQVLVRTIIHIIKWMDNETKRPREREREREQEIRNASAMYKWQI